LASTSASTSTSSFLAHAPTTTDLYTLSLHDALPIYEKFVAFPFLDIGIERTAVKTDGFAISERLDDLRRLQLAEPETVRFDRGRSEEHMSELQSPDHLVCRLLLEKKHYHQLHI